MEYGVDLNGLKNQMDEERIKSGSYIETRIVIGKDEENIMNVISGKKFNIQQLAKMILTLEATANVLKKQYPEVKYVLKDLNVKTSILKQEKEEL